MNYILFIGANSSIAKATAEVYAENGYNLILVARNAERLKEYMGRLEDQKKIEVKSIELDILKIENHYDFYKKLPKNIVGVVCAVGYLGDQQKAQNDSHEARIIIDTNFTSIAYFINLVAKDFEDRGKGFITVISSVAGERGRKSNYFYGAAKAGLTAYLSGLRNRLHDSNIHVLTVIPGYVMTNMTKGMKLPEILTTKPNKIARAIYKAQLRKKNVLYYQPVWLVIMLFIRSIPEFIFKRMNL